MIKENSFNQIVKKAIAKTLKRPVLILNFNVKCKFEWLPIYNRCVAGYKGKIQKYGFIDWNDWVD